MKRNFGILVAILAMSSVSFAGELYIGSAFVTKGGVQDAVRKEALKSAKEGVVNSLPQNDMIQHSNWLENSFTSGSYSHGLAEASFRMPHDAGPYFLKTSGAVIQVPAREKDRIPEAIEEAKGSAHDLASVLCSTGALPPATWDVETELDSYGIQYSIRASGAFYCL